MRHPAGISVRSHGQQLPPPVAQRLTRLRQSNHRHGSLAPGMDMDPQPVAQ